MGVHIKDRAIVSDPWRLLSPVPADPPPEWPGAGDVILPLSLWIARRPQWLLRPGRIGVWLDSHEDPEAIAEDLRLFGAVAVHFPKLADGRGYSIARSLRDRFGYRGELRAFGDVTRDQLAFLEACGFNAFTLRAGEDPAGAIAAFNEITEAYQGSAARPLPLFRRRHSIAPDGRGRS